MSEKCHILEGTNAGGSIAYVACGRALNRQRAKYVGRARILEGIWVESVTCSTCRRKYKLAPEAPNESEEPKGEAGQ